METQKRNKTVLAYIGIISVVLIWGLVPTVKKLIIVNKISASLFSTVTALMAAIVLFLFNIKNLKELNKDYFKIAVPSGACLGIAALAQAFAYNFNASPTNQAFLENLSCLVVPLILFFALKKKPTVLTILSAVICLISSMVLSGVFSDKISFKTADILNAFAGVMYGVNIAITGIYAKKFIASLYVMIQLVVKAILSLIMTIAFNYICIGSAPVDPLVFDFDVWLLLTLLGLGVISNALCWTVRTSSMKYISPNAVAIIMPFSSAVTGIFAIVIGQDQLTLTLLVGVFLGLAASFMSASSDIAERNRKQKK